MKSNICCLETDGYGREKALNELDLVGSDANLDKKSALRLHLLGEELVGLMNSVAGKVSAEFWVEVEDGTFKIHLMTNAHIDSASRKQIQSVSTTGKNEEAKGILGKVRMLFEACINGYSEPFTSYAGMENFVPSFGSNMIFEGYNNGNLTLWSLDTYESQVIDNKTERAQEWDELEKSIIANLADDITVGIRNGKAEIVVIKKF